MKLTSLLLILIFVSVNSRGGELRSVEIPSQIQLEDENVTLGALARDLEPELAGLILGASPVRGKAVVWTAADLGKKLRAYQTALKEVHFKIPKRIKITRVDSQTSETSVQKKITEMLKRLTPASWEVSLKSLQKIEWPEMSASALVQVVPLNIRPKGAAQFEIVIEDQGKTLNHLWVNGNVEYFASVPVVQRPMIPRSAVRADDIQWEKRNVTYLNEIPATENDFIASVTKISLPTGTVVTKNHLDRDLAVHFGDEVEVFAGEDGISVSTKMVAQQNGYVGDVVKLRTNSGAKFLTGVVLSPKKVQVSF